MKIEIIPAILTDDIEVVKKQLKRVGGLVSRVQIDIIDGLFAKNKTISIESLERVEVGTAIDLHLMVSDPIAYVGRCDRVGVERIYAQIEKMDDQGEFVDQVTDLGMQVGLAIDLDTPAEDVEKTLPYLDGVLLMSVRTGFQGQKFSEKVLSKIDYLVSQKYEGDICIDGGLTEDKILMCAERGANHFSVGSDLWKADNIKDKLDELRSV